LSKKDVKSYRVKGVTIVIILIVAVVAAGALTIASVYINGSSTKTATLIGVLAVYSPASGSDQVSASYNVTLISKAGVGTMSLEQISGSSDLVADHSYAVSDVVVSAYNITMTVSDSNVSMGWITTSTIWTALNASYAEASGISTTSIWNDLNSSYVAASGPDSPANQTIGVFSPSVFQLPSTDHMFIGLTIPDQPVDNIPFAIAPIVAARTNAES
jgi:hypothetical protein